MRKSNDSSETKPTYLDSLGVMDLDISLGPDAFGLRAFDEKMPSTRMLPGAGPCDLRLLIPDAGLGKAGFFFTTWSLRISLVRRSGDRNMLHRGM